MFKTMISPSGRHIHNADNHAHGKHGAHDSNACMTVMKRFTGNILIPVIVTMILILVAKDMRSCNHMEL